MSKANGTFRLETEDSKYVCKMTTNAMAAFEDRMGYGIVELGRKFEREDFGIKDIRALVWAVINWNNFNRGALTEEGQSIEEAGDILDEIIQDQGLEGAVGQIAEGLSVWMPDADFDEAGDEKKINAKE